MFADCLITFLDVALDHEAFDQTTDIGRNLTIVHDFLGDTDLFFEFFAGIRVVCVNDSGRVYNIHFFVHFMKADQILIMVVLYGISVLADCSAENDMR